MWIRRASEALRGARRGPAVGGVVVLEERRVTSSRQSVRAFHCAIRSRPCRAIRQSSCASSRLAFQKVAVLLEQQIDARFERRVEHDARRRACARSGRRALGSPIFSIRLRRKPAARNRGESSLRRRLSNIFCVGCARSGRLPSTEPPCAASSSRSRTCAPARRSAPRRRLLPPPVGPWMTMKSSVDGRAAQFRDHETAVGLVTAFEGLGIPADLAQDVRHGAGALAAAPAVDRRMPGLGLVAEEALDSCAAFLARAQLLRLERGDLLAGADLRALIVEHRRQTRRGCSRQTRRASAHR